MSTVHMPRIVVEARPVEEGGITISWGHTRDLRVLCRGLNVIEAFMVLGGILGTYPFVVQFRMAQPANQSLAEHHRYGVSFGERLALPFDVWNGLYDLDLMIGTKPSEMEAVLGRAQRVLRIVGQGWGGVRKEDPEISDLYERVRTAVRRARSSLKKTAASKRNRTEQKARH